MPRYKDSPEVRAAKQERRVTGKLVLRMIIIAMATLE